jgi:hypothetical protein
MPRDKDVLYWNKKDGSRVLISEMSNDYLLQTISNLESQAKDTKGKTDETKLDSKYHVLRMHAVARNLINN